MQIRQPGTCSEWSEERLRYRVLRSVYDHAGGDCTSCVTPAEVGCDLSVTYEDLYRATALLVEHGFLFRMASDSLCITPRGIRYIERAAGRRLSLRLPMAQSS
jgi:hypothetical protein